MKQGEFIGDYEVLHSIRLDGHTHVVAQNTASEDENYRIYKVGSPNAIGLADAILVHEDKDYLETMREYVKQIDGTVGKLYIDRAYRDAPGWEDTPLTKADCFPDDMNYEGQVVAVKSGVLSPEYRTASFQLHIATGGFGCSINSRGRTVFCTNIYDGEKASFHRADIIGVVLPERIPEWARTKIAQIQKTSEKPSVMNEIKQSKQDAQKRSNTSKDTKTRKKSEPDL